MPLLTERALAHTYSPAPGVDAYERVELYRESQRYPSDWGSQRVATRLDVSRSEIRAWVDGDGMPDAARAIEIAGKNGWLDNEWSSAVRAIAMLVAGVIACGSISQKTYAPSWSPANQITRDVVETALVDAGVGHQFVPREDGQADEVRPLDHGSILGRALVGAGAPVGDKTAETVTGLPEWIDAAPPSVRASFVELLVRERGAVHEDKATRQINTNRSPQYFREIAALIEDVTGESATSSDNAVTISADAVRALGLT